MSNETIYCIPVGNEWNLPAVGIAWIVLVTLGCCCRVTSGMLKGEDTIGKKLDTLIAFQRYKHNQTLPYNV